jgi:hypothetical protein
MKIFNYVLLALIGLTTLTAATDVEAYWHGYRGGWREGPGWRGPGWGGGCWRCGPGWGPGAVVAGAVVGATIAEATSPPPVIVQQVPTPEYVQQPAQVVVAPAGNMPVPVPVPVPVAQYAIPPIGSTFPNLFPGCFLSPRNNINFYQCQGFRMRPLYGGNNFYYRVVP